MEEAVRKGIEKANEDLRKENEKIFNEKVIFTIRFFCFELKFFKNLKGLFKTDTNCWRITQLVVT
jgi:hypothetical protein